MTDRARNKQESKPKKGRETHSARQAPSNQKVGVLTPRQQVFVNEYLVDLNASAAAVRAGYSARTAKEQGYDLLTRPHIQAALEKARKARTERTNITQDMVLERLWHIATANPNDLISYRRVCCRHCFGEGHEFQWVDEAEWERAVKQAIKDAQDESMKTGQTVKPREPSNAGGYGFDPSLKPHPKCPKCNGEGHGEVFAKDTRELTPQALALYAGVKVTKEGLEIKMQDQSKALELIARHLGMFNDKLTLKGDAENPLAMLFTQLAGKTLKPVEVPEGEEE